VLGGADIDGDGEDELILLKRGNAGYVLDFRRINFAKKRTPEVGSSVALSEPFTSRVVGASGIQFDGDREDEIAVVVDDGTTQSLTINDITIAPPPSASSLTAVAGDPQFGGAGERVQGICVIDYGLDGTAMAPNEQIVALTANAEGVQSLKIFDPPAGLPNQAVMIADDPGFGVVKGRDRVLSIACTR
jgi:hypothetical protein